MSSRNIQFYEDSHNDNWMLYSPQQYEYGQSSTPENWMLYTPPSQQKVYSTESMKSPTAQPSTTIVNTPRPSKLRGRKRLSEHFPGIVESAKTFIEQNSFAADPRRRTTTARSCGVSLPQLQEHLQQQYNEPVSTSTIRRWMAPPNKTRKAASRYLL